MLAAETAATTVRATVNYFDPALPRGRFDLVDPALNRMAFEGHEVAIRDLRDAPGDVSIDRQGFMLASHESRAARQPQMLETNVTAQLGLPPINQAYYDELLPLIHEISGAREVIPQATGLTVRFSPRSEPPPGSCRQPDEAHYKAIAPSSRPYSGPSSTGML